MGWVVKDIGPSPRREERVWGPFATKAEAKAWSNDALCDCCTHKVIRLYGQDWEGDCE